MRYVPFETLLIGDELLCIIVQAHSIRWPSDIQ